MTAMTTTFYCCPSRIPTSAFGKRDVGAMGWIPKRSHYCSAECRIRHEFDLWTHSFCPAVEYAVSRISIGM
jgi:hypothetical protein